MTDPWLWLGLVAALIGGYFACCHVALKNFGRARLNDLFAAAGREPELAPFLDLKPTLLLMSGTLRTCMSMLMLLCLLIFVEREWFGLAREADGWAGYGHYVVAFALTGLILSIFVVSIPESVGRYMPEALLFRSARFLRLAVWLFLPLARFLHLFDPIVRRLSGYRPETETESQLSDEVLSVVEGHGSTGQVDETQKEMIEAVFELKSTAVDEIMTPRTDIRGVEVNSPLHAVKQAIQDDGFSRLPVYEESIDHIVGLLYAKDLLRFLRTDDSADDEFDLREIMREALMVPETKPVRELLAEFKARKVHIAIVLDEYGGTAGLITVEDIIEEIIGDIQDEYEAPVKDVPIVRIDEQTMEVDARVYVDDLNDELPVDLPEDEDYDTLGGFVFSSLGHVPAVGESFEFRNLRLTVIEAERTRVLRVRIEVLGPVGTGSAASESPVS
ncbi:MAG: HlyC/CorC family transporter [Phycisphaeraceae bacterium]|nr:HlyC/CorC family transporter [Phycisphaeraceae bacterium]